MSLKEKARFAWKRLGLRALQQDQTESDGDMSPPPTVRHYKKWTIWAFFLREMLEIFNDIPPNTNIEAHKTNRGTCKVEWTPSLQQSCTPRLVVELFSHDVEITERNTWKEHPKHTQKSSQFQQLLLPCIVLNHRILWGQLVRNILARIPDKQMLGILRHKDLGE